MSNEIIKKTNDMNIHDSKYIIIQQLVNQWLNEKHQILKYFIDQYYNNIINNTIIYTLNAWITNLKQPIRLILKVENNVLDIIYSFEL